MRPTTYTLQLNAAGSDAYYETVSEFTDEVLHEATANLAGYARGYLSFVAAMTPDKVCSEPEYIFELLMLGTLWKVYAEQAQKLTKWESSLLKELSGLRQHGGMTKPALDWVRGILTTWRLAPQKPERELVPIELQNLDRLISWLAATGDFRQEAKRLSGWRRYLSDQDEEKFREVILNAICFALWFEIRSVEVLGAFTENVNRFIADINHTRKWREDLLFCGRRRVEYHLNMVGAEIMNRAFREKFLQRSRKAVLLPTCMRHLPVEECKTEKSGYDEKCTGCTAHCRVNQVTKLGEKMGFETYLFSHGSGFHKWADKPGVKYEYGVIGVACVVTLVTGGWEALDLGIPAQCVLLEHCGCRNHWHETGLITEINLKQLARIASN